MHIELPDKVKLIIKKLTDGGYEAYAVGGCVRDSLLGRNPHDWDITTSAKPEQVKELFARTIDTGIQHGTVTVMFGKDGYEVTTYRIDGEYEDGRHPLGVTYTNDLREDLRRRDFTINAMAYNDSDGLVDIFGGAQDIEKKLIRAVGNPNERFEEDALRIMRAVRFSAQLGYEIEDNTKKAATEKAYTLSKISAERIQSELNKTLMSKHPEKIRDMYEMGITKVIMPEFDIMMETKQNNPHHIYSVGEHTICALMNSCKYDGMMSEDDIKAIRIALLFHDSGKPICKTYDEIKKVDHFYDHPNVSMQIANKVLKRLKYDNNTINKACILVKYHDLRHSLTEPNIKKDIIKIGKELVPAWLVVTRSDIYAQSDYQREDKVEYLDNYEKLYKIVIEKNECISLKDLEVNGKDLINAGISAGAKVGEVLNYLLEIVISEPEKNNKDILMDIVKNNYLS